MTESPLALLVVLAALVAVPLVLRRFRPTSPDVVRVLGRTAIHKGAILAVVAVGSRRLLVGAGERGVHLITELAPTDDDQVEMAATTTSTGVPATSPQHPATPRTDAGRSLPTDLEPFLAPGFGDPIAGPRIGLVDRLRAMTVRTPVRGRPLHVLRR